jgi:hypothetical protein
MQWQPMSMIAPPPDSSFVQNQLLCGPGCASRERVHSTRPIEPFRTDCSALRVLGV